MCTSQCVLRVFCCRAQWPQVTVDLEVIDLEDEMEALDTLAAWLSENCERPGVGDSGRGSHLLMCACQATAPGSFGRTAQRSALEPLCCCKYRWPHSTELVSHRPALSTQRSEKHRLCNPPSL